MYLLMNMSLRYRLVKVFKQVIKYSVVGITMSLFVSI